MNETRHYLGTIEALRNEHLQCLPLGKHRVALAHWEGRFYAFEDECPHIGASLGFGELTDDGYVSCSLHGWEYCIKSGAGRSEHEGSIDCFRLEEEDGKLFVYLAE